MLSGAPAGGMLEYVRNKVNILVFDLDMFSTESPIGLNPCE